MFTSWFLVSYVCQIILSYTKVKSNWQEWKCLRRILVKENSGNISNEYLLLC